jgi:2'-5' RNA ligase
MENQRQVSETIRAFIAAEISEETRTRMGGLLARLRETGADVKWSRPGSIHLTLRFLGETRAEQVDMIAEAMAEAAGEALPVPVSVEGWGLFPNERRPRVIWLGLKQGGPELSAVFEKLERALLARGLPPADKAFSPHLTLGRVKSGRGLSMALAVMKAEGDRNFGEYTVDRLVLIRSQLHPAGAIYTPLRESRFKGQ